MTDLADVSTTSRCDLFSTPTVLPRQHSRVRGARTAYDTTIAGKILSNNTAYPPIFVKSVADMPTSKQYEKSCMHVQIPGHRLCKSTAPRHWHATAQVTA